ncbi:hypothetical protein Pla86_12480 [Planctomycetes bacterium Pla86]|uniref:Cytochrome c domain-containing protein n=2 Tax=Engelhardtia mirabilis TaxID=2528011 RepID=A0A518BGS5_9BACT|nr:hypothetical protein Pla133_12480 [Planctomycetes bacterium Pla133]QDV00509.1 hypothetical protein Pla86_12480 [Planctomycetes bacterium Pla86]
MLASAETLELIRSGEGEGLPEWADLIARNDTYGRPIAKMLADMPPVPGIAYAFLLRNATRGWTLPLRKQYFEFFLSASTHPGGNSCAKFLENMRDDAIATVGRELVALQFAAGQNLYRATACSVCHRFDGQGRAMGPDLTTVANDFSLLDRRTPRGGDSRGGHRPGHRPSAGAGDPARRAPALRDRIDRGAFHLPNAPRLGRPVHLAGAEGPGRVPAVQRRSRVRGLPAPGRRWIGLARTSHPPSQIPRDTYPPA